MDDIDAKKVSWGVLSAAKIGLDRVIGRCKRPQPLDRCDRLARRREG
jgi:hypothetical protein